MGREQGGDLELIVANSDSSGRIKAEKDRSFDILTFLFCGIVNKCGSSSQEVRTANNRMDGWMNG